MDASSTTVDASPASDDASGAGPSHDEPKAGSASEAGDAYGVTSARLVAARGGDWDGAVLARLERGARTAWMVFSPSGDDLYADYAEFTPGVISPALCRGYAARLRDHVASLEPSVTVDAEACDTVERDVVHIDRDTAVSRRWIEVVHHPDAKPSGWYAHYADDGRDTELWVWGFVPEELRDKPVDEEDELFDGYVLDALYWGAPSFLMIPDPQ